MTIRHLLLLAAVAATLAACNRKTEEETAAPVVVAPPPAVATGAVSPLAYDAATPFASVKLALPEAIKRQPELHQRLYASSLEQLKAFTEGAQADRTEAGGDQGMAPYEMIIAYAPPVETGKLFSLSRSAYDFSGGAHGNTLYSGVLWDKALKREVAASSLFRPGADLSGLDSALCEASNVQKKSRDAQAVSLTLPPPGAADGADWSCVRTARTPFVLTPSTVAGKAGGLTFLIGPYQLGPYSDGAYQVVVPQARFRALLAPAYADEFAGAPLAPAPKG